MDEGGAARLLRPRQPFKTKHMNEIDEIFLGICEHIKQQGFRVFKQTDTEYHYGFFTDGIGIGYFEYDPYVGTTLNTVNRKYGSHCSGYRVYDGDLDFFSSEQLTPELLRKAFVTYPEWVKSYDRKPCTKYRDIEQFMEEYWNANGLEEVK